MRVVFEGPSLAGKSTAVAQLGRELQQHGIPTLRVPEYTELAGGHSNFPPLRPASAAEAIASAEFFLDLENRRRRLSDSGPALSRVNLVDRALLSLVHIRRRTGDLVGAEHLSAAIAGQRALRPEILILLRLPQDPDEVRRRRAARIEFDGSDLLYDAVGYSEAIKALCVEFAFPSPVEIDEAELGSVLDLIISRWQERGLAATNLPLNHEA